MNSQPFNLSTYQPVNLLVDLTLSFVEYFNIAHTRRHTFKSKLLIMKKSMLLIPACLVFAIIAFIPPKKNLVGSWVIKWPSGTNVNIDFRGDGTVKAGIPAENFTVEGKYKYKGDIITLTDSTCGKNYWGKYKVTFLSDDSAYSVAVEDSCMGRKSAMDKATLVRVK